MVDISGLPELGEVRLEIILVFITDKLNYIRLLEKPALEILHFRGK